MGGKFDYVLIDFFRITPLDKSFLQMRYRWFRGYWKLSKLISFSSLFDHQIEATEECIPPPSERPKPKREDGLDHDLAAHISGIAFKLALSPEEKEVGAKQYAW